MYLQRSGTQNRLGELVSIRRVNEKSPPATLLNWSAESSSLFRVESIISASLGTPASLALNFVVMAPSFSARLRAPCSHQKGNCCAKSAEMLTFSGSPSFQTECVPSRNPSKPAERPGGGLAYPS